jgi:hypothetical protein
LGIIDISYIETLVGYSLTSEEEVKTQRYINIVSSYIESKTGRRFSVQDGAVVKAITDGKGIIEIPDLTAVDLIEYRDAYTGTYTDVTSGIPYAFNSGQYPMGYGNPYDFGFDGISMIYGLIPRSSYRITCTYGVEPPEDIQGIVADLVLAGTGLDTSARGGLASKRVGDVEEFYGVTPSGNVTLTSLMTEILNQYDTGNTTYRL